MSESAILLDVTRLVARSWTRRLPTGIDRVCYAYLRRFAARAYAVIQHRGIVRVLDRRNSDALFQLLGDEGEGSRGRLAFLALRSLLKPGLPRLCHGGIYLNVGHTDFDLKSHAKWVRGADLRPVYMVHDLIPITHAHHCREHAVRRHTGRVIGALRNACGVIVSTGAVADDLEAFAQKNALPVPPMVVASLAGERMYPKPRASTEGRPYFLCVGTIESRKNHALLVNIWRRLIERNGAQSPRLLIVGQWGVGSQRLRDMLISSPQLHGHVTVLDRCGDEEMGRLVKGARALLMPTLCEGFGLPMVEAIQLGTPVIATDLPCFREIGQGIPTLLPPSDEAAWEALIEHFGPEHPEHIRQLDRARQFRPTSWNDHFFKIEDWLPTLSERKHPLPERANHSDRLPMSANLPFLSIE